MFLLFEKGELGLRAAWADEIQVRGLIDLIGCERKLSYLAVSGLTHQGTVEALKKGFLKQGGKLVDLDSEEESAET